MYAYHEWLMLVLQIGILVALIRMWANLRSNFSSSGRESA
jgi:hypothetical protein